MIKIRRFISIDAPLERVYEFMTNPDRLPEIWPSLIEVSNVKTKPDGGHSFDWVYKMAGVKFNGRSETTEVVKNDHYVVKNEKGITSTFRWSFAGENGHTKVTMDCEYEIPSPLLAKIAKPFIERLNEHEARIVLDNLKARMELEEPAARKAAEARPSR